MIRHISMFTLADGTGPEDVERFVGYLREAAEGCELVVASEVGVGLAGAEGSGAPDAGGPQFADVVQVLDFAAREDADAYPASAAHQELFAKTSGLTASVVAIDYEV